MARELRHLAATLNPDGATLRTMTFEDREHLVVPVIALLGDAVVRPLGSQGPEFVPADELASSPQGWNGRPVVPDHPDGGRSSANEPRTLETFAFGRMFNTRFEDKKLKTEAWLDTARASKQGGDAARVIERCLAGEAVEVSVGCYVTAEQRSGIAPGGERYDYIWRGIVPDHLAMLPEGATGACSVEMGCGAPRAARETENRKEGSMSGQRQSLVARVLEALGLRSAQPAEGTSDVALRDALWGALRADEPGFEGIVEVFPDSSMVVYAVSPEDSVSLVMRGYALSEDGEVTLADDRTEVEPVTSYEPIKAAEQDADAEKEPAAAGSSDCGCNGRRAAREGEPGMNKVEKLIGRLIACKRSPFTDDDLEALGLLGEEKLSALAEQFASDPEPVETDDEPEEEKVNADVIDADVVQLRREEYEEIRAASDAHKRQQKALHTELVNELSQAQKTYTEEELRAMSVDGLQKLANLVGIDEPRPRDYSGRGARVSGSEARSLPDPYGLTQKEN